MRVVAAPGRDLDGLAPGLPARSARGDLVRAGIHSGPASPTRPCRRLRVLRPRPADGIDTTKTSSDKVFPISAARSRIFGSRGSLRWVAISSASSKLAHALAVLPMRVALAEVQQRAKLRIEALAVGVSGTPPARARDHQLARVVEQPEAIALSCDDGSAAAPAESRRAEASAAKQGGLRRRPSPPLSVGLEGFRFGVAGTGGARAAAADSVPAWWRPALVRGWPSPARLLRPVAGARTTPRDGFSGDATACEGGAEDAPMSACGGGFAFAACAACSRDREQSKRSRRIGGGELCTSMAVTRA